MPTRSLYAQAGVDTVEGDKFSHFAAVMCHSTYENSRHVRIQDMSSGNFRGPRAMELVNLPSDSVVTLAPDGIGTKVVIIDAAESHYTAGVNLIEMVAMDITRWGGVPVAITNVLDAFTIGKSGTKINSAARLLIRGLSDAANLVHMVLFNGETAELSQCVGSENPEALIKFNWAAAALGLYHHDKMILGDTLAPGQIVMALRDKSLGSNGISLVRRAFATKFGAEWWKHPEAQKWIGAAALPCTIYDPFLNQINGWNSPTFQSEICVHSIIHVTGGGFQDKFGKDILFKAGLSAKLDKLFEPPEVLKEVVKWCGVSDEEIFKTFNAGQRALAIIDPKDQEKFIERAADFRLEAQPCGKITETEAGKVPTINILSQFTGNMVSLTPKPE